MEVKYYSLFTLTLVTALSANAMSGWSSIRMVRDISCLVLILSFAQCTCVAQNRYKPHANYDNIKTIAFRYQPTLPNPLRRGNRTISASEWRSQRTYLKKMLTYYQYGEMPGPHNFDSLKVELKDSTYLFGRYDSTAIQKKLLFTLYNNNRRSSFRVGLVIPLKKEGPLPVIIKNDKFLFSIDELKNKAKRSYYKKHKRGSIFNFGAQKAVQKGYVLCKFIRDDVAGDHKDNRDSGIFPLYPTYSMGTIAAWAWGYSVIIDWLEKQPYIDATKIVATGHSRGGKTALCAGIYDQRIAVTVPNASGAGGTASLRYFAGAGGGNFQYIKSEKSYLNQGEHAKQTLATLKEDFPYWWIPHFFQFVDSVAYMPFDAHFNKLLIAPRALLNTMARQNFWTNPYGTYLTYLAAGPVYKAYGKPKYHAVHWRDGGHNQDIEDWDALFDYCDWIFFKKPLTMKYNQNPYPNRYIYNSILKPYFKYFKGFGKIIPK